MRSITSPEFLHFCHTTLFQRIFVSKSYRIFCFSIHFALFNTITRLSHGVENNLWNIPFSQTESYVFVTYAECYWSSENLENIESTAIQKLKAKNEIEWHPFHGRKIIPFLLFSNIK